MKFLYDLFPILLFFIAYKAGDIFIATGVAIAASFVQVGWSWLRHRSVEKMHVITLLLLIVFGGLTIALRDPVFVMWKVTLVNWLFALAFLGTLWIGEKPLVERMMGGQMEMPRPRWRLLNHAWTAFFVAVGALNLWVANFAVVARDQLLSVTDLDPQTAINELQCASFGVNTALCEAAQEMESLWVNFKLFGVLGLTLVIGLAQAFWIARHAEQAQESESTNS